MADLISVHGPTYWDSLAPNDPEIEIIIQEGSPPDTAATWNGTVWVVVGDSANNIVLRSKFILSDYALLTNFLTEVSSNTPPEDKDSFNNVKFFVNLNEIDNVGVDEYWGGLSTHTLSGVLDFSNEDIIGAKLYVIYTFGYETVSASVNSLELDLTGGDPSPCRWTSFVGSIEVCE
jgi:hypothetical protein